MGSVLTCIVSDRIGPGEVSRDLVARASHLLGMAGGAVLTSTYLALSVALEALGIAAGDAVVLPALAPALYLRVLRDRGLRPLVADVDAESGLIDTAEALRLAESGAKAVIATHGLGMICDVEALRAGGLPVIEDASQALGGKVGEKPCGGAGDVTLVSLAPEHIVTCGGGALILARAKNAAAAMRRIVEGSPLYEQLADMNAALGIAQLAALDRFVLARRELAQAFQQSLMRSRHASLVQKLDAENVLSSFPVVLADGMKETRAYALKRGVETSPAFADSAAAADEQLTEACPRARSLMLRCLLFPLYPMLARRDVEAVSKVLATLP
jgi:dTDP-4-amino-4,6-dideoxygalactose transaminase